MTAHQAVTVLDWFRFKEGEIGCTKDDIEVIENVLLPLLKDNKDHHNNGPMTYDEIYYGYTLVILQGIIKPL